MKKMLSFLSLAFVLAAPAFANGSVAMAGSQSFSTGGTQTLLTGSGWKVSGSLNGNQAYANAYTGAGAALTSSGSQSVNISGAAGQGSGVTGAGGFSEGAGTAFAQFKPFSFAR